MAYNTITTDKYLDLVHAEQICDVAIAKGNQSIAVATGSHSQAIAQNVNALAIALGERSMAKAENSHSIAFGGVNPYGIVKGVKGSFLVLTECTWDGKLKNVVAVEVDGEHIKPDIPYVLLNGYIIPWIIEDREKYPTIEVKTTTRKLTDEEMEKRGIKYAE